jgi:glutathione-specific gamma-glutamylcyclotransferase
MALTRTDLESRILQKMILESGLNLCVLSEAELQTSIHKTLQQKKSGRDIWLFAYGSLIWNPIFPHVERRVVTVYGKHRRFCLWAPLGRGTPDNPGLVLGLDRGGSCRGIAYRLDPQDVNTELLLVWRREMVVGSYHPRWITVDDGVEKFEAIAFVVNRDHSCYASQLSLETIVNTITTACGHIGSCADYLLYTVDGLKKAGIKDKHLNLLGDRVIAQQKLLHLVNTPIGSR